MANISIEPVNARRVLTSEETLAKALQGLSSEVDQVRSSLDYKIAGKKQIDSRLAEAVRLIALESERTTMLQTGLEGIIRRYEQAEDKNLGNSSMSSILKDLPSVLQPGGFTTDTGWPPMDPYSADIMKTVIETLRSRFGPDCTEQSPGSRNWLVDFIEKIAQGITNEKDTDSPIKTILGIISSWGGKKEAGILKNLMGYAESLAEFITGDKKGLTAASTLCTLTDKSVSLWKGAYDYLRNFYQNPATGFFGDAANKKVAILDLVGKVYSAAGTILSSSEGLGDKNLANAIADYLDVGKDGLSIFNSSYSLKHLGDTTSLLTEKAGPWSAANVYTAIAQGVVNVVQQGLRSYDKYSADGKWDIGDTGSTGMDIALSGLYGITHSLTLGFDDIIFGKIDEWSGGSGDSEMSYVEKAAEGYKILGVYLSEKAVEGYRNICDDLRNIKEKISGIF